MKIESRICIVLLLLYISLFPLGSIVHLSQVQAQTADELQQKIDQRNVDIKNLEKEIQGYQTQIDDLSSQANSLSGTIKSLELTQKKLDAVIKITENKIATKNLEIEEHGTKIVGKQSNIDDDRRIISSTFVNVNEVGNQSLVEELLGSNSLSQVWDNMEKLALLEQNLHDRISVLNKDKSTLEVNKKASEVAKIELVKLNNELKDQRNIVLTTQAEKNQLLKDTKKSESRYQIILAQNKKLKEEYEREVLDYESRLRIAIDSSKIPHTGSGVLKWPLDSITITQYFGNTPFSTANPQIYKNGHPGVDFRATIGTPIKAALSGIVTAVVNDYTGSQCYPYGKWIMIRHTDGLSTLYAHLSLPTVTLGQSVATGETIGYSGNTGLVTGPHLHFAVYASEGVRIVPYSAISGRSWCNALYPSSPFEAKLNPLSYL